MLCPKSMFPYWREIWLERIAVNGCDSSDADAVRAVEAEL
jgi:hypothetical protein